jgi:hypothetical protein
MRTETFVVLAEWLEDQRLNWTDRALLAKLYSLTYSGSKPLVSSNLSSFLATMGLTNLRHSWKRIIECGYITKTVDKLHGNITTVTMVKMTTPIVNMTQGYRQNDNSLLPKRQKGYSQNDVSSLSLSNNISSTLVSGTHSNHTPISFNFDYVKSTFDDCVNELLNEYPYLKQVDLNKSLQRYWYQKHTKIEKGYWKKGEKVTEQSLKDSILSWLLNENKPEQVNSEEDFSQDLNDLENDLLLTNFTPADKGDYQQSANDGFTECEVIEDEHSNSKEN